MEESVETMELDESDQNGQLTFGLTFRVCQQMGLWAYRGVEWSFTLLGICMREYLICE